MSDIYDGPDGVVAVPVEHPLNSLLTGEWAEHTAPTLAIEDWRTHELLAATTGEGELRQKSRALLAYRDEVARGLTAAQREWLCEFASGRGSGAYGAGIALRSLAAKGLATQAVCPTCGRPPNHEVTVTTWGRVIAERVCVLAGEVA